MKKLKLIMLGLLSTLGIAFLASCSNETESSFIDMTETEDEYNFASIALDLGNVKTNFYLGDEFSYTGLVVNATYTKTGGTSKDNITKEITDYTVDYSDVDMSKTGSYVVQVIGRSGVVKKSGVYVINVLASELAQSGNSYLAGLEINLNQASKGYVNNNTVQYKIGEELELPKVSSYRSIYFKGTDVSEADCRTLNQAAVTVDSSKVDMNTKGTYVITYTYTSQDITVKSFVLVIVSNPVTAVEFKAGDVSQAASVNGFAYDDWSFTLTEESGSKFVMNFDEEYFSVSGVNSYVAGSYTAKVIYTDADGSVNTEVSVVVEQTTAKLVSEFDLSSMLNTNARVKLGETNYFHFTTGSTSDCEAKESTFDNITFDYRAKFNGAGSKTAKNLEVYMPNAGQIVVYYGTSSGGSERTIECQYEDGETIGQASSILTANKAIFEVSEAGTYYIYSLGSTLYFYGVIIAYEAEGAVEPDPAGIEGLTFDSGITHYIQNGSEDGLATLKFNASFDDNTSKIYTLADDEMSITGFDKTVVGNQTVTATFDDGFTTKSCEFTVNVTNVTLTNIEYVSGTLTERASMGNYDVSDFVIKANYSDSSTKNLSFTAASDYELTSQCDSQTLGAKKLNITFVDNTLETKTLELDVTITKMDKNNLSLNGSYLSSTLATAQAEAMTEGFNIISSDDVQISDQKRSLNGFSFTKRINFRAKGSTTNAAISFQAKAGAKVVVYAMASSGGKTLYLSSDGDNPYKNVVYSLPTDNPLVYEFTIDADGTYYLIANNAAYIEYVGVEYNQKSVVDEVASTITSLSVYSPVAEANTITVDQGSTLVLDDIILKVTYSDGAISFITLDSTTYTDPGVSTAVITSTPYSFNATYGTTTVNVKISVIASA